jgi:hypothetical protein
MNCRLFEQRFLITLDDILNHRFPYDPTTAYAKCEKRISSDLFQLLVYAMDPADRADQLAYLKKICLEGQKKINKICAKLHRPLAYDGLALIINLCESTAPDA